MRFRLGAKKTWGSDACSFNAEAFYYNYQNDQQPLRCRMAVVSLRHRSSTFQRAHLRRRTGSHLASDLTRWCSPQSYSYLNSTVASMDGKCVRQSPTTHSPSSRAQRTRPAARSPVRASRPCWQHARRGAPNKIAVNATYPSPSTQGSCRSPRHIWKDKTFGAILNTPPTTAPAYSQSTCGRPGTTRKTVTRSPPSSTICSTPPAGTT